MVLFNIISKDSFNCEKTSGHLPRKIMKKMRVYTVI